MPAEEAYVEAVSQWTLRSQNGQIPEDLDFANFYECIYGRK